MDQEVELKLALSPDDAERISGSSLLQGQPEELHLVSTYFDTPDQRLRKSGFSLRIRVNGHRRIQTLKTGTIHNAGLFARHEWEHEVQTDLPVVEKGSCLANALGDRLDGLRPVFEASVTRDKWDITENVSHIEVVLDRGQIIAGKAHIPVCELELELKSGEPSALFSLARKLDREAPLRLCFTSKGERGYRALAASQGPIKAEPVELVPDMTAAQALQKIALNCLRHYRLNEDWLLIEGDHRAIHQARVALRRLRSALSLFRPMLKGRRLGHFMDELRWLTGLLGQVRNLDVVMHDCVSKRLRTKLEQARAAAYPQLRDILLSDRCRALMLDLAEWLETGRWLRKSRHAQLRDQPARKYAQHVLERLCDHVLEGGRDILAMEDEARHEVRKAAKKLRYGVEFFALLFDEGKQRKQRIRFLAALEELQDHLGALNDLGVRQETIHQLGLETIASKASCWRSPDLDILLACAADDMMALAHAKRFWR